MCFGLNATLLCVNCIVYVLNSNLPQVNGFTLHQVVERNILTIFYVQRVDFVMCV